MIATWRIPPASGVSLIVSAEQTLRVTDAAGGQPCDLNAFVLPSMTERFSAGRTRTMEGVHPGVGASLWSGPPHDRRLFTITTDTVGANDVLFPRCSRFRYEEAGLDGRANCQDILADAIAEHGLGPDDVHDSCNFFMATFLDDRGRPTIASRPPLSPGSVELVAHLPCLVALSACPNGVKHERANSDLLVERW